MPRSLKDILEYQNALAKRFEDHEPGSGKQLRPDQIKARRELRRAAQAADKAQVHLIDRVADTKGKGESWESIGKLLGTSGEGARQKYGKFIDC